MRICVTGTHGQIARALIEAAGPASVEVIPIGRPQFDLEDPSGLYALLVRAKPDIVVHAAAYTAVDKAEQEPDRAMLINGQGAGAVAIASAALSIPIIHFSTDYVFDGAKATPYHVDDTPGPLGSYGRSKLAGEQAVVAANPRHVILRTAWVYSRSGKNFLRSMLSLGRERPVVRVVSDQFGSPSYAVDLARAVHSILPQLTNLPESDPRFGLYHLSGTGDTSWSGFAEAIFADRLQRGMAAARVEPIATSDYPTLAPRPANSRLDCSKFTEIFGFRMPHWSDGLSRCLTAIDSDFMEVK